MRIEVELTDDQLGEIARRAAEMIRPEPESDAWLDVKGAAAYLACPESRIYSLSSADRIPRHRDGSRLLFRRSELDAWIEGGGARRP